MCWNSVFGLKFSVFEEKWMFLLVFCNKLLVIFNFGILKKFVLRFFWLKKIEIVFVCFVLCL